MNKLALTIIVFILFAGITAVILLNQDDELPSVQQIKPEEKAPTITETQHQVVDGPLQQVVAQSELSAPLPELDESDGPIRDEMATLIDDEQFENLFLVDTIIRNIVVSVDNLTRQKLPNKYRFTQPVQGKFSVTEDDSEIKYINPDNYNRYISIITLIEATDTKKMAAIYTRLSPLFQKAYDDLGYPDSNFTDRLIEVINHLTQTPELKDPIKLEQPNVYYTYADPELEALSSGQKIMIRMGYDNTRRLKIKLRDLLQDLTQ
jgi:hypothetical protein